MWEWAEGEQGKWETDGAGGGNVKGRLSAQAPSAQEEPPLLTH